ncbi:Hydrocephalus-inducing protein [Exaiptasia diaphana]|nr:Hydrocephalus-inducing protein [Exaiptasia diaphana]
MVNATGQGSEPKVDFSSTLVEFGPVLPHSNGDEQEVIIKNPCDFPIEIYSLEFDKQYLEEEKMLRNVKGYDEYNTILLPPRQPGEKLPSEVVESYQQQQTKKEEEEKAQAEAAAKRQAEEGGEATAPDISTVPPTPGLADNSSEVGAAGKQWTTG